MAKKIILATLLSLQLATCLPSEAQDSVEISANQSSQITELLQSIDTIKARAVIKFGQFLDKKNYPNMSLIDLGNEIIDLLNNYGQVLPQNIRNNLIDIVNIKMNSKDASQFRSGHVLINDTLIVLIDTLLNYLHSELNTILKFGVTNDDITRVRRELTTYRKKIDNQKRNNSFCSIESAFEDLKKIGDKLKPLLLNNPVYVEQIKRKIEDQDNSAVNALNIPNGPILLMLIGYRISKNCK